MGQQKENAMSIDNLTFAEMKQIAAMFGQTSPAETAFEIGGMYLIRTVTYIISGRLVAVTAQEFVVEEAAWIADTGRYAGAVATGDFSEVEPYPPGRVIIGRGGLIDAAKIPKLPKVQK